MNSRTESVNAAIERGLRTIKRPARRILAVSTLLVPVAWVFFGLSWWPLLFIPFGVATASRARAQWRLSAYANVADIHQLQRSAELAELLPSGSHSVIGGWLSFGQRKEMSGLLRRFSQDVGFVDDPTIPENWEVFERALIVSTGPPVLVLSKEGIRIFGEGAFAWEQVDNERIASVGFKRMHPRFRHQVGSSSARYFRVNCASRQYEFRMEDIGISAWKLDLLLYIYRGRSTLALA